MLDPAGKNRADKSFWNWCCLGRCLWFHPLMVGIVFTMSVFAFVICFFAWNQGAFASTQKVYTIGGAIQTSPMNHVLGTSETTGILAMTLPNNMLEYAGAIYDIDCPTPFAHTITIQAGPLPTTWDGTRRVATCSFGGGFQFRVISSSAIRVVSATGVTFT